MRVVFVPLLFVALTMLPDVRTDRQRTAASGRTNGTLHDDGAAREGLWVYGNEVRRATDQQALLQFAAGRGINTLYLNVYQSRPNAAGRRLYDEEQIAQFVMKAHRLGIEVWAAYGAVSWHRVPVAPQAPPYERMKEVVAYNRAHPNAAFDGVMLDLEPPEPADLRQLISTYRGLLDVLRPHGIDAAAAIRFFWDETISAGDHGVQKPAYQHILDLPFDHVVVMAYRNFAGDGCEEDGIICLSRSEIHYASRRGKRQHVVVGLRNTGTDVEPGPEKVTFHGQPQIRLRRVKEEVASYFGGQDGFGGFAMHRYRSGAS